MAMSTIMKLDPNKPHGPITVMQVGDGPLPSPTPPTPEQLREFAVKMGARPALLRVGSEWVRVFTIGGCSKIVRAVGCETVGPFENCRVTTDRK